MHWGRRLEPPAELPTLSDAAAPGLQPESDAAEGRGSLFWWIVGGVIAADQAAKALLRSNVPLYDSRPIIPGIVDFVHVRNEGVAFGLLNQANLRNKWLVTTGLALLALTGVAYFARHIRPSERLARMGLSLILGGALGNLVDRLTVGYVIDFVDVYWRGWHFWAFNVADASISIGAVLVFADLLLGKRHASHSV
jgi:signal peptidase II